MRIYLIILSSIFFAFSSCKKDEVKKDVEIPFPEGWFATQKVRINRVELKKGFGGYFWYLDSTCYFEYMYDSLGQNYEIKLKTSLDPSFEKTFSTSYLVNPKKIVFQDNKPPCQNSGTYNLEFFNYEIKFDGDRISKINGIINECTFGFPSPDPYYNREALFSYNSNGLLKSIDSDLIREGVKGYGNDIYDIKYDNSNAVKSLNVIRQVPSNSLVNREGENLVINFEYQSASDVPDDLRRKVNQSILELNSLGFEDFIFQQLYQPYDPNAPKRGFADWFCTFGTQQLQTISAQNIGLISSKHLKGKRANSFDEISGDPILSEIDSVANFPYIHDASSKTLEIAGLKIYYELVE